MCTNMPHLFSSYRNHFFLRARPGKSRLIPSSPISAIMSPAILPERGLTTEPLTKQDSAFTVSISDGTLKSSSGAIILQGLPSEITSHSSSDGMSLILGAVSSSGATASLDTTLGQLTARRFMALGRTSLWWMSPAWGTPSTHPVPGETQFLLLQLADGTCALMLPLLDAGKFRATLRPGAKTNNKNTASSLGLRIESGAATVTETIFPSALYIAAGKDPYELIARGVAEASSLSGTAQPRVNKAVPPVVDKFLWCTWDAFYSSVSAAGVKQGLASLVAGGTPPRGIIIDDGWQITDVDPQYRRPVSSSTKVEENTNGADAGAGATAVEVQVAVHKVEEAAMELFAAANEQAVETLKGEHEIEEERTAVAATAAAAITKSEISEATTPAEGAAAGTPARSRGGIFGKLRRGAVRAVSAVEATLLHVGRNILDNSQSDSYVVRGFSALAAGAMRPSLLRFYAHATEHTRRLSSIEANAKFSNPDAGPEIPLSIGGGDLVTVVQAIKSEYGVEYVYAWHAMGGFWGGLGLQDPDVAQYNATLLMPTPTPSILEVDPAVAWVQPVIAGVSLPLDPTPLHHDMHAYLSSCGIDGVKVDVQGTIGLAGSAANGGPALAAAYHASLEASVARHFPGNHLINCMCHSTEDLYNFQHSNLARVSDDFYPLSTASHTTHIANCSFNSLFMGEVIIPDWDMFHSKHPAALLHAAARAVSGGPVYVSDKPGHHDFDLLKRLVFSDGSVLRALLPGRPTADCLFEDVSHDNTTALKVWNMNAVTGVVGVFNVQGSSFSRRHRAFKTHDDNPPTLTATVHPTDVPTLDRAGLLGSNDPNDSSTSATSSTGLYVMYSDQKRTMKLVDCSAEEVSFTDGVESSLGKGDGNGIPTAAGIGAGASASSSARDAEGLKVEVAPNGGCDIITISPVFSSPNDPAGVMFAPIGLVNMLNAGAAVLESEVKPAATTTTTGAFGGVYARVVLRGSGQFLAYSSHRPVCVVNGGKKVEFEYDAAAFALKFEVGESFLNGTHEEWTINY